MRDEHGTPFSEEELALAREGEALISAAMAEVEAPQSLREAIERERASANRRSAAPFWRRRGRVLAGLGAVAAAAAVAIAVQTGGEDVTEPSYQQVQAAASSEPAKGAPATLGGTPPVLDLKVGRNDFPDWRQKFGWRATGERTDTTSGRTVKTVFYENPKGARLGYAIVEGKPLSDAPPGREVRRNAKAYSVAHAAGRTIITWTQAGNTCVIVAPDAVPEANLLDLADSRNT